MIGVLSALVVYNLLSKLPCINSTLYGKVRPILNERIFYFEDNIYT